MFFFNANAVLGKYDQMLIEQARMQTKSLCYEIDFLTKNTFLSMGMPTVPARFFTDSFLRVYFDLDFSQSEEADLFLNRYRKVFKDTLNECWPQRPNYQKAVLVTIELSIWEGKAVGALAQVGMVKGAVWSVKRLIKYSKLIAGSLATVFAGLFAYSRFDLVEDEIEQIDSDIEVIDSNLTVEQLREAGIDIELTLNANNRILMLEEQLGSCTESCGELQDAISILKMAVAE